MASYKFQRRTQRLEGRLRVEGRIQISDLRLDDRFRLRRGLGLDDGGLGVFLQGSNRVAVALAEAHDLLFDGAALAEAIAQTSSVICWYNFEQRVETQKHVCQREVLRSVDYDSLHACVDLGPSWVALDFYDDAIWEPSALFGQLRSELGDAWESSLF